MKQNTEGKSLLLRAVEFAERKHAGQFRKGTEIPYITHPLEVMDIVSGLTEDEEVRAAAVLHDTLEDTDTAKEELVLNFGQRVADLVEAESENKREDRPAAETWMIRKQETIRHLGKAGTDVRMIALGDKLSNVRAMSRDYKIQREEPGAPGHVLWPARQRLRGGRKDPEDRRVPGVYGAVQRPVQRNV